MHVVCLKNIPYTIILIMLSPQEMQFALGYTYYTSYIYIGVFLM